MIRESSRKPKLFTLAKENMFCITSDMVLNMFGKKIVIDQNNCTRRMYADFQRSLERDFEKVFDAIPGVCPAVYKDIVHDSTPASEDAIALVLYKSATLWNAIGRSDKYRQPLLEMKIPGTNVKISLTAAQWKAGNKYLALLIRGYFVTLTA